MSTMKTSDQIDQLVIGLHKFHGEITTPKKNKTADTGKFKYEYADLTSLLEHCKDALQTAGLVFVSAGLTSRIVHVSGQWIEAEFAYDLADLPPQQIGIALSYGRRYCLQALLGINADEDNDAEDVPAPPPAAPGTTKPPKKDPAPAPAAHDAPAKPAAPPVPSYGTTPPPGPKKLDINEGLPKAPEIPDGGMSHDDLERAEKVRFVGYAQPKTLTSGAVKMGVRVRFADGSELWADSWDPLEHKKIQDAILKAKKAKQDGVDMYAVLERDPKADGSGDWIKIAEWMPR